jgi:propionyl-CoA carboxylase alpha subunit
MHKATAVKAISTAARAMLSSARTTRSQTRHIGSTWNSNAPSGVSVASAARNSSSVSNVFARMPLMTRAFSSAAASGAAAASEKPLFDKILVANRGEIACRVISTCKKMGIKTVAVYSDADATSKFVQMADEAVNIGPPESAKSYLDMNKILDACKQTGAQAVHPGYGFLSENIHFCDLLEEHNIVFIGPKHEAIKSMGLKIDSKLIAKDAGVNIVPGFMGAVETPEQVTDIANDIGYPVMIKASAGGGGKGMRIAWNDTEAVEGYQLSKQEALSSFGDDTILIEKYIEEPRHIEIQLLCDSHGNGVYVNERECSIQRRNQKVIEEAPSTFLDPETRKQMGEQALALAQAVGYQSAGTVEFLVDKHRNFYFLEMNTRLQVEHPVSEYIAGIDLVEHMIRVAAGEKLALTQDDIGIKGWAFESRVYAEDPFRNFLPSIGRLTRYEEPTFLDPENIRCDSGILEGSNISMFYDPMICKLVTHGETRDEALEAMRKALDSYVIRGVTHNISFLRAVCDNEKFKSGNISTYFIQEEFPHFAGYPVEPKHLNAVASAAVAVHVGTLTRETSINGQLETFDADEFKQQKLAELVVTINDGPDRIVRVDPDTLYTDWLDASGPSFLMEMDGTNYDVSSNYQAGSVLFDMALGQDEDADAEEHTVQVLSHSPYTYKLQYVGTEFTVKVRTPREDEYLKHMPAIETIDTSKAVLSPMPGAIVSLNVKPGDSVVAGEVVAVIEAMKMQNAIRAEVDGVVKSVAFNEGDSVGADDIIVHFK